MAEPQAADQTPAMITTEQVQQIVSLSMNAVVEAFRTEFRQMIGELRDEYKREVGRFDTILTEHETRMDRIAASANGAAASAEMLTETVDNERTARTTEYNDLKNLIGRWHGEFEGWKAARDEAHTEHRRNIERVDSNLDKLETRVNSNENNLNMVTQQMAQNMARIDANNSGILRIDANMTKIFERLDKLAQPSAPMRLIRTGLEWAAENKKAVAGVLAIGIPSILAIIDAISKGIH